MSLSIYVYRWVSSKSLGLQLLVITPTLTPLELNRIPLPDRLSVLEQQCRYGDESNSNESQHAISPAQPKRLVHTRSSKRKHGPKQTTQTRHACDSTRGVLREAVDHVSLQGRKDTHDAKAEGDKRDDGHDPVHFVVRGPAVPEEADGDEEAEEDAQRETHFRLVDAFVALCELDDGCVGGFGDEADADEVSYADA